MRRRDRSRAIRVLIVDDEPLARDRLRALAGAVDDFVVVGECADGVEAVEHLLRSPIDLVFLDVHMPRLNGFGVLAQVGAARMPLVIFTSAYSEFAVRAFEAYALDYLLKPFDDARFDAAVGRARLTLAAPALRGVDPRVSGLLEFLGRTMPTNYPESIAIRSGSDYAVIKVADIDWIEADGNYAKLYVAQRPRLLTRTLATLEKEVLDPTKFARVHRSAIVNISKIGSVEKRFHGDLTIVLLDGTRVECSRRHRTNLEERLYFAT